MTVLRLRKAAEEPGAGESTMWRAIESGGMSTELTEDGGAPNVSLRQLPAPGKIAASDLAARLARTWRVDSIVARFTDFVGSIKVTLRPRPRSGGFVAQEFGSPFPREEFSELSLRRVGDAG
jgi:hypothetical protein